jgi:hypothetical protein
MHPQTLALVAVATIGGLAAGFGLGRWTDGSDTGSRQSVITIIPGGSPASLAAQSVVMAYVTRTYPNNPLRTLRCGKPYGRFRSVGCDVLLAPDNAGNRCLIHMSLSVELRQVVNGIRFADCVRGQ